ncbi:uncharacterized protein METZ01_LOCUS366515, partial [marine metagenome]
MATVCGGLIFVLLTARSLGPSGRGEIVVAFTLAWLTTSIANLGTPISGRFHLLREGEQVRAIDVMLLTVLLLPVQVLLVLVSVGVMGLTVFEVSKNYLLTVIALSTVTMFLNSAVYVLYGLRQYRRVFVGEVGIILLQLMFLMALELTGRLSVESALIAMMTGSAVIAVWFVSQLELTLNRPIRDIVGNWRLLAVDGLSP